MVVTKVDGERTISALEKESGLSSFDVCKVLYGLVSSGLIGLRASDEKPEQGAPAGPSITTLLALTENVRRIAEEIAGPGGVKTVEKHYRLSRTEIENGKGMAAVQGMVDQLARAITLIKGGGEAGEFLRRVTPLVHV